MDRQALQAIIEKEVFITRDQGEIVSTSGTDDLWLFDFRRVILRAEVLDAIAELFWERCKGAYPFQIGGVEVAAIPLIAGCVLKMREKGRTANGFFIRKSRKKSGLLRMIEGALTDDPIVLVDDLMHSGNSILRQVEVLEALGKKVSDVFTILRFRDESYYTHLHKHGIRLVSLFDLNDFAGALGLKNLVPKYPQPVPMPFKPVWYFKSEKPNYFYVVPKSAPVLDATRIYFGSDKGSLWALNQSDGSIAWEYRILFGSRKKRIFSSPMLYADTLYFGGYDGNFYALDAATGKKKWIFMEADWIGSSPCVAPNLGLVFVGLEFGLWKKQGGVVALDAATGEKKWEYRMSGLTHSSPAYSEKYAMVVCGCNNFSVYAYNASNGKLLWETATGGEVKESFAFEEKRGLVCFGSFDAHLYILSTKTGTIVHKVKTNEAIYSTPCINGDFVYVASLDKTLYCINLDTGDVVWKFQTGARIFASPKIVGTSIYIGSNDGRLYELDAATGKNTAFFQATERITNKIAYNKVTKQFFVPTFANEIYCLMRTDEKLSH